MGAKDFAESSGELTAGEYQYVSNVACGLAGFHLIPAAANADLTIHNANSNAANQAIVSRAFALANGNSIHVTYPKPIRLTKGLRVYFEGVGAKCVVDFVR